MMAAPGSLAPSTDSAPLGCMVSCKSSPTSSSRFHLDVESGERQQIKPRYRPWARDNRAARPDRE